MTTTTARRQRSLSTGVQLKGFLEGCESATGLIVFVHGSGSSRFSVRNNQVAEFLRGQRFATLLMDLLTASEDQVDAITRELRFNIPLLAERVTGTLDWLAKHEAASRLPIGLFGASTGAAAALIAAASQPTRVRASSLAAAGRTCSSRWDIRRMVWATTCRTTTSTRPCRRRSSNT